MHIIGLPIQTVKDSFLLFVNKYSLHGPPLYMPMNHKMPHGPAWLVDVVNKKAVLVILVEAPEQNGGRSEKLLQTQIMLSDSAIFQHSWKGVDTLRSTAFRLRMRRYIHVPLLLETSWLNKPSLNHPFQNHFHQNIWRALPLYFAIMQGRTLET